MKDIGIRIKETRQKKGLTQQALADLIDNPKINKVLIEQYECGNRKPKKALVYRLANILEVDYLWLCYGSDVIIKDDKIYVPIGVVEKKQLKVIGNESDIGKRIKYARQQKQITQKELASKFGVSASVIGQYEIGLRTPKKDRIADLSILLDVNYLWLLTGYEKKRK